MKVLLILKISRGKVTNFSEVTKFFHYEIFPLFFFPDKVLLQNKSRYKRLTLRFPIENKRKQ